MKAISTSGTWKHYLLIVAVTIIVGQPLLKGKINDGHDTLEYVPRLVEFHENIRNGIYLPRWAPDLDFGYGMPLFVFNPPVFYYCSEIFYLLGFDVINAVNVACLLLLLLSGLGMYWLARDIFGGAAGTLAAIAYLTAPYTLVELYVRHAYAEFSAFPFMQLSVWSLYRLHREPKAKFFVLAVISTAGVLGSHLPMALIFFPFLLLLILFSFIFLPERKRCLPQIGAVTAAIGLMSYIMLPALLENQYISTHLLLEGYLSYTNHFSSLTQMIDSPWGYGISLEGFDDGFSLELGKGHLLALLIVAVLFYFRYGFKQEHRFMLRYAVWVAVGAMFLSHFDSKFLWDRIARLQYMEFPWRYYSAATFGLSLLIGGVGILHKYLQDNWYRFLCIMIGLYLVFSQLNHIKPKGYLDRPASDFTPGAIAEQGMRVVTKDEYRPIFVEYGPTSPTTDLMTVDFGPGHLFREKVEPMRYVYRFEGSAPSAVCIHTSYYPGWTVYIDGIETQVKYDNPWGRMFVTVPAGKHEIVAVFEKDTLRRIAELLGLFIIVFLLVAIIFRFLKGQELVSDFRFQGALIAITGLIVGCCILFHNAIDPVAQQKAEDAELLLRYKPHMDAGLEAYYQNDIDTAIKHFEEALSIAPNVSLNHYNMGVGLDKMGRADKAAESYRQALALKPYNALARINLGYYERVNLNLQKAINNYRYLARIPGFEAKGYRNLGFAYQDLGRLNEARHYWNLAEQYE